MRIRFSPFNLYALTAVFAAVLSFSARAQSFDLEANRLPISQIDSTWRFHLGDDPRWAQPHFDDSAWPTLQPGTDWTKQGYPKRTELAWFRFHLRVPAHTQSVILELPAIEKSYQLFSDGKWIAQVGTLPPGPAHNVIGAARVFTLPVNSVSSAKQITVALRLWQDPDIAGSRDSILEGQAYAGASDAVLDHFSATKAIDLLASGSAYTLNLLLLIVGAATALLFWLTRERFYIWFACYLIIDSLFFAIDFAAQHQAWNFYLFTYLSIFLDVCSGIALVFFIVEAVHAGKWKYAIVPGALTLFAELSIIFVLRGYVSVAAGDIGYCLATVSARMLLLLYLVHGWRAGNLYAKLLFFPFAIDVLTTACLNTGYVLLDFNVTRAIDIVPAHYLLLHQPFEVNLDQIDRAIAFLGMLAVLVYRFARTSREQQRLSAALKAAHDIQQRLVPVDIPALGGLHTEIAYRAAEEVGGDFCQILPRPDGSIFVAIGDVSGKGLQAAMLGAVAVGALRSIADEKVAPNAALERLNNVLLRTKSTGFITCLCMVLSAEGEIILANAGHLSPYLDGAEIPLEANLPLGIVPNVTYSQSTFILPAAARLTLLSDGVVEARSSSGELFGFDRTSQVSRLPASEIAAKAHEFGQEDDITVITLDWHAGIFAAA